LKPHLNFNIVKYQKEPIDVSMTARHTQSEGRDIEKSTLDTRKTDTRDVALVDIAIVKETKKCRILGVQKYL
jgi:hypothetical protein